MTCTEITIDDREREEHTFDPSYCRELQALRVSRHTQKRNDQITLNQNGEHLQLTELRHLSI